MKTLILPAYFVTYEWGSDNPNSIGNSRNQQQQNGGKKRWRNCFFDLNIDDLRNQLLNFKNNCRRRSDKDDDDDIEIRPNAEHDLSFDKEEASTGAVDILTSRDEQSGSSSMLPLLLLHHHLAYVNQDFTPSPLFATNIVATTSDGVQAAMADTGFFVGFGFAADSDQHYRQQRFVREEMTDKITACGLGCDRRNAITSSTTPPTIIVVSAANTTTTTTAVPGTTRTTSARHRLGTIATPFPEVAGNDDRWIVNFLPPPMATTILFFVVGIVSIVAWMGGTRFRGAAAAANSMPATKYQEEDEQQRPKQEQETAEQVRQLDILRSRHRALADRVTQLENDKSKLLSEIRSLEGARSKLLLLEVDRLRMSRTDDDDDSSPATTVIEHYHDDDVLESGGSKDEDKEDDDTLCWFLPFCRRRRRSNGWDQGCFIPLSK